MQLQPYKKYKNSGIEWLGEIPAHWEVNHNKRYCNNITDGAHTSPDLSSEDYPFLSVMDLNEGKLDFINCKYTSKKDYEYLLRNGCQPEVNDVLFSKDGTIGQTVVIDEAREFVVGSSFIILKPELKKIFPKFFHYFLSSSINQYQSRIYVKGAGLPRISIFNLSKLFVNLPPIPEQTQIATYLDHQTTLIDQKIKLLQQKIEKYQELQRSLINETVCRGLDKNVPLKDSGVEWIGEIPEHWEIIRIKDFTYVKGRIGWQGLRSDDFLLNSNYYCVTGTDFKNGSIDWSNCYCIDAERYDQDAKIQLNINDLLITKDGTIGKIALVKSLPKKATLNSGVFVTRPLEDKYLNEFMFWVLNSNTFRHFIDFMKNGSTILHLYQNVFERFSYPLPSLNEQEKIATFLTQKTKKFNKITTNLQSQITTLQELRKTLINDVVTGKVKVPAL